MGRLVLGDLVLGCLVMGRFVCESYLNPILRVFSPKLLSQTSIETLPRIHFLTGRV